MSDKMNGVDMTDQIHDKGTTDIQENSAKLDNSNRKNSDVVFFPNHEAAIFATNTLPRTGINVYLRLFHLNSKSLIFNNGWSNLSNLLSFTF